MTTLVGAATAATGKNRNVRGWCARSIGVFFRLRFKRGESKFSGRPGFAPSAGKFPRHANNRAGISFLGDISLGAPVARDCKTRGQKQTGKREGERKNEVRGGGGNFYLPSSHPASSRRSFFHRLTTRFPGRVASRLRLARRRMISSLLRGKSRDESIRESHLSPGNSRDSATFHRRDFIGAILAHVAAKSNGIDAYNTTRGESSTPAHPHQRSAAVCNKISAGTMRTRLRPRK